MTHSETGSRVSRVPPSRVWGWIVPLPPDGSRRGWFFVRWLGLRILLFYAAICAMLAGLQRTMIYHPSRVPRISAVDAHQPPGVVHEVTVPSPDGDLHGWHMLAAGQRAEDADEANALLREARWVVLYFPGNAGTRAHRTDEMQLLAFAGAHVVLVDYRGYGDNPGSPCEAAFHEDARASWKLLTEDRAVPAERILLFGESLGSGSAVRLAADLCSDRTPPGGLILRAPFSSLSDAAAWHFPWLPVRWLLVDTFRNDLWIGEVTCPILHLHGTEDSVVPYVLGEKLFALAPERSTSGIPKTFVALEGTDHNDIMEVARGRVSDAVEQFLTTLSDRDSAERIPSSDEK